MVHREKLTITYIVVVILLTSTVSLHQFSFIMTVNALSSISTSATSATSTTTTSTNTNFKKLGLPVLNKYKESLLSHGLLDLQKQRPIQMKALHIENTDNIHHAPNICNVSDICDENHITTKIIHFQRHGQGYHNLLGDVIKEQGHEFNIDDPDPQKNPFVKPEIQDSPLTFQGREEAKARRKQASMLSPQLIIVSPLQRAVQTAMLSFADHIQHNSIPFIAHEGCREQLGLLTCNKALPLSQTKIDFPQVDFSLVSHGEHDTLWSQYSQREHPIDEANRAYQFLTDFVMNREESEIAIICHSAWLFSVCNAVIDCAGNQALESWFETGEIRSLQLIFKSTNDIKDSN